MSNIIKLTDLVQRIEYAEISAGQVRVRPLGVGVIARILLRFPVLLSALESEKIGPNGIAGIADIAPAAIPVIIAHGCGTPGPIGEQAAESLTPIDQVTLLAKIFEVSFPGGLASFFDQVRSMADGLAVTNSTTVPADPRSPDLGDVVARPD